MSKKVKKVTMVLSVLILLIIGIITGLHIFNKKDEGIRINLVNLNSKKSDSTYIEIKKNDTFEIKNTSSEDEIIFTGPTNGNELLLAKSFDVQGYDIEIPDSIILQLKDGEKVVAEIELNEENNWTQSLSPIIDAASANPDKEYDLIEYSKKDGELKHYIGNYEFVQTESDTPKLVLTNTVTPVLALQKNWNDNDNEAGKRPESVTLELFQEETLIHSCEVSEETSWLCETPITTYDPTLTYTLKENFESELYTSEITATPTDESGRYYYYEITNTFSVPDTKIEFPVEKVWDDNNNEAGERPDSVDIAVVRNGKVFQTKNVTSAMDWKYTFTELPKYDEFGNEYYYEVIELDRLDNYETTIENGVITNTYKKLPTKVSFDIVKNWNDNNNALNKRPSYIEVEIYGTNVENATTGGELLETITLSESNATDDTNKWKTITPAIETSYKYFYVVENNGSDFYKTTSSVINSSLVNNVNDTSGVARVIKPTNPEDVEDICIPALILQILWENEGDSNKRPESIDVTVYSNSTDDSATKTIYGKFRIFEDRAIVLEDPNEEFYSGSGEIYGGYSTTWGVEYAAGFALDSNYYWIETDDIKYYNTTADIGDANTCDVEGTVINTYEEESTKYQVTLTNTFEIPDTTTNVVINKIWSDNNDEAQKRPDSIVVDIYNGNTIVETATITEANGWEYTSKDLPYYDESANIINYTVQEKSVDFYESSIVDVTPNSTGTSIIIPQTYQITNTFYVPEDKVNITVNKVWDDNDNAAGKRLESITLQIKNGDTVVGEQSVTAEDNWEHTFEVPKYDTNANEIIYTADEKETNNFYEKTINGTTVTNTFYVPEDKVDVTIKKVWEDNSNEAGKRPESITLQIKNEDTVIDEYVVTSADSWKHTFTVPKYDENANEITYTADELELNKFYQKTISGTTVTNTFGVPTETIDITATKVWNDNNDKAGKRPESVTLQIKNGNSIVEEIKVTAEDNWTATFTDLPKYNNLGNEISYTVDEKETPKFYKKEISGTTVTNTFYVPEDTKEVTATKVWKDNSDKANKRPDSIFLQVKDRDTVIEEKEVTAYDNWSATFTVPKYDENADEKSYSVDELETPQFYKKEISGNTITNTFYVPEDTIEIEAKKIWDDNDNEAEKRLETITFQLKNGNTVVKEQKVTETDEWTYTFTNLPKYDENADEIKYTLDELETSEFYIKTISEYTITNKFVVPGAQKEISGQKIWDDYNNAYNTRPESVKIEVYGNDELVTEYVISSENDWKFDIKLDLYDDYGNEIEYTLKEEEIDGYDSTIEGYTITNKLETRKIKTEVIGEGGTISGDEDVPYGSDSTIDNIIIKPSNGYILGELRINGELIDIDNKSEEQILEIIKNVREDQLIQVTFVKEKVNNVVDNNPNTSVGESLIIVIIISLINIFGFKTLKRKKIVN